ncbi:MAG: AzlC family ABC transporter permease [Eubacterium aggregans]|uniref:4-azaleucine resistance probable transporter AzlC n=1 Tax=Eubacterium aggregans TaxID=81409 RepID=A0A1H3WZC9_9FIRM|nr:AzlC family ABC transporter permease [Eubacterium aggregans]MDD4692083.1 AzlC family ABC transporter permease [Eubacterium aggregans]MEA5074566.1 AzlC family ABC transporter permease [Eubacterium aggregans]SDZ92081.1 4-azaleucine resistance probable transporter AzlC [Eubacterium aggregans]
MKNTKRMALEAAFPHTLPIMAGFLFLGMAYGIYAHSLGFSFVYPMVMALTIFAGSMEFVAMDLLLGAFNPLGAFLLALMVNARHLFYGIAMLDKYRNTGKKEGYLIFGMCDESFSINCTAAIPEGVDAGWFMFFVTLLNQIYWVLGATLGGLMGNIIPFNTQGLDFVMTALFIVLFLEQWFKEKNHASALIGIVVSVAALILLGGSAFIIPAMIVILALLILLRSRLDQEVVK